MNFSGTSYLSPKKNEAMNLNENLKMRNDIMKRNMKIGIYLIISLMLFMVEFTELNLIALTYYVFALLNLYNAVRLANKYNKST